MKKILWFPAWYPNKIELLTGDFIQRHAKAVSLYHRVQVIHLVRDKEGKITKNVLEETHEYGNLKELIIYYNTPSFSLPPFDRIISALRYRKLYQQAIKKYLNEEGNPACVHVHIINRNGLMALWLRRKYKIPFVISEHWTAYLPEATPNFKEFSFLFKVMWRKIVLRTKGLSVVSQYLANAIAQIRNGISSTVIPNVVDSSLFFPVDKKQLPPVGFIHISSLDYQKNPEAILQAFAIVKQSGLGFTLSVVGPEKTELTRLAEALHLQDHVHFYPEVPQPILADYMKKSDALILYSRYETFGCVLIEANACGIPVIVSDIPVHHETIQENMNGFFVPGENAEALAQKIIWFIQHYKEVQGKRIADAAKEKYNFEKVGKLFSEFYCASLGI